MNKFAKISLILWIITVGTFGFFFFKGSTTVSSDKRKAVALNAEEKDLVLSEMRHLLFTVNGILKAVTANDKLKVIELSKGAGMSMAADVNPILMAKLPIDFKTLGMGTHKEFDKLALEVESNYSKDFVIKRLSEITNNCIACHTNFRLP
jgi:hypothetical protein